MGAAVEDIKNIISRRFPLAEIVICPTVVQGGEACEDIANSVKFLDTLGVDVIIVGRGGGSMEDLWAFNTMPVIQAVYDCNTPIIPQSDTKPILLCAILSQISGHLHRVRRQNLPFPI